MEQQGVNWIDSWYLRSGLQNGREHLNTHWIGTSQIIAHYCLGPNMLIGAQNLSEFLIAGYLTTHLRKLYMRVGHQTSTEDGEGMC